MLLILQVEHEEILVLDSDSAPMEEPQPMEAEPVEAGNAVDAPTVDDPPSVRFTWTIDNLSSLNNNTLYSDVFVSGGHKWQLLIFPRGCHLSLFVAVADWWELPSDWTICANFSLAVVNQNYNKFTVRKETQHEFNSRERDRGFRTFISLKELYDPDGGYLVNNTCIIEADIAVRKAVYHMPTTEALTIPLALQSIFYKLQYGDTSVSTKELTTSFGWGAQESFIQHDVQELNRTLCEKLEEKMKGTVVDDLQLDVKGCRDVYASFDKYVEVERLEGDNKYHAEQHGLQDAEKGVLFTDFPPVLQLHLKRFEYDYMQNAMVKINDRYEFPLQLDLDREDGKYLSPQADRSVRNLYTLHRLKFDDERITKEDMKSAMDEQYGGEDEEDVAKEFGIPVHCQRFWLWSKRRNHTYQPTRPLTLHEEAQSIGNLIHLSNNELELFLEVVEFGQDILPISPPEKTNGEILLFFKLYDPLMEELRYAGRLLVKDTGKPIDILERLNEMAGFAPDEEIELFQVFRVRSSVQCAPVEKELTFLASEVVRFRSLEKPNEDEFSLELSKTYNYDAVVGRLAHHLNLDDPSKIRLTSQSYWPEKPKTEPIKYRGVNRLSDMLNHNTSDILYYEVLDIPLPELEGMKTLDVTFHDATKNEVVTHTIRLPKESTVGDVINDLKTKVELSNKDAELRLLEINFNRISQVFSLDEKIEDISDFCTLRVEEVPEEEKDLGLQDCLVRVQHCDIDSHWTWHKFRIFGEPFLLVIHEGETLAEVKVRIQKKLEVPDEEFSKWKFSHASWSIPTPLKDSDIVSDYFQKKDVYGEDVYGAKEHFLQVEHSNNSKRPYTLNQAIIYCDSMIQKYLCDAVDGRMMVYQIVNI
ncbi:ubiquitin-specific protease 13 [Artemisia annua]|uniref:ubiquitinyl hydrolase 1 n=1 Tax=Artemisia annua TaxID=35608 RepID=A0A2U1PXJ9_ARTAN|nr:ubiquitin-specific protease 13 [Artemisia annua]